MRLILGVLRYVWKSYQMPYILTNMELATLQIVFFFAGQLQSFQGPISRFSSLSLRQTGWHFADSILRYNFVSESDFILIKISPKFVLKGLFTNMIQL